MLLLSLLTYKYVYHKDCNLLSILLKVDHLDKHQFLEEVAVPFIHSLIGELEDAFRNSPLLQVFGVLDPRDLPNDLQQIPDYGSVDDLISFKTDNDRRHMRKPF